jgi:hypothetical protein
MPFGRKQSASRPMQEISHDFDGPSLRDSALEFAQPNELRSSIVPSHPQPDVTVRPVPMSESSQVLQEARPTLVDGQRQESSSSKTSSRDSDIRRDDQINSKFRLQINSQAVHRTDEITLNSPRQEKPVLSNQQELSSGPVNSVVEIHSERQSELPWPRLQAGGRVKEIIPLSATKPRPSCSVRSQPVGSPVVQPAAETIVHVTIGRVEVRATVGNQKPVAARESSSRQSSQSLGDYLRGTSSGRSS